MDTLEEIQSGYFYYSNLNAQQKEIYLDYKQFWDLEQYFDYLKTVYGRLHLMPQECIFKRIAILNHMSLLYCFWLLNILRNTEQDAKCSAEAVLKLQVHLPC